jgi:prepilin-type N-terminal cleavage/methylation domain-containing protein
MRSRRGLSLIELLVVIGLVTVLAGAVFVTSLMGGRLYYSSETSVHIQQQVRQAFDNMVQELRQADGTIATAANQVTFQLALGYDLAAPCPNDAVCIGALDEDGVAQEDWSVRYRLNGAQLVREILDDTGALQPGTRVLANDVTSLSFTYTAGAVNTIVAQLQVQRNSQQLPGGSLSAATTPLVTRVKLRNS